MTPNSQRFEFRVLGISREMERLETEAEQQDAFLLINLRIWSGKFRRMLLLCTLIAVSICMFLAQRIGATLGLNALMPLWLYQSLWNVVVTLVFAIGLLWFSRRQYARGMREYLVECGIPTCLHCGYNLTGASATRCPECGSATVRDRT